MLALCAAVSLTLLAPLPGVAAEPDQQAKTFTPLTGKAAIYVYRKNGWRGSGGTFPVTVDGKRVGQIANGTFYWLEVDPGEHEVWVGWDPTMPRGLTDPIKPKIILIPFNAQAGQTYFVRVAQQGWKHVAVIAETGKAELLACCTLAAPADTDSRLFH
jgi:hypothetical protein